MLEVFVDTLSWGVTATTVAVISGAIFELDKITLRNVIIASFIIGCIRGYTL